MEKYKNLSDTDANKVFSDIIESGAKILPEHLLLAISKRSFIRASQFILSIENLEECVSDVDSLVCNILQSPLDATQLFNVFAAALAVKKVHLPQLMSNISGISLVNINYMLPILAYHVIDFADSPNINFELKFLNKNAILDAHNNAEATPIVDVLIEGLLNLHIHQLSPKLNEFNEKADSIENEYIPRRINELTKAVDSYSKNLDKPTFKRVVDELLNFITKEVVPAADSLASISASLSLFDNAIPNILHAYKTVIHFCEDDLTTKPREYVESSIKAKFSNRLQHSIAHSLIVSYMAAVGRSQNSTVLLAKLKESAETAEQRYPQTILNYDHVISEPLARYKKIISPESSISKSITAACNTMCTVSSTCEYMLFDAVLHNEAAQIAKESKFYPIQYANVLQEFNRSTESHHKNVVARRKLLEDINTMVSDFLRKIKTAPGAIISADVSKATAPKDFKIPSVPIEFQWSPEEVHSMLCDRQEIIGNVMKLIDLESAPMCMNKEKTCKNCATIVCKHCRKLVLCQKHCNDETPCPLCGNPIHVIQ